MFKIQSYQEIDAWFLQEAAMRDDSGLRKVISHVGVWEIFVDELRPLVSKEVLQNSRVNERYLRVLEYHPSLEYLMYGEEEIRNIPQDKRENFIKKAVTVWIQDIFTFLKPTGIAYFDILPLMHDHKSPPGFSLEEIPVGEIDRVDQAYRF